MCWSAGCGRSGTARKRGHTTWSVSACLMLRAGVVSVWACTCGRRSGGTRTGRWCATCSWRTTSGVERRRPRPRCWSTWAGRTPWTRRAAPAGRRRSTATSATADRTTAPRRRRRRATLRVTLVAARWAAVWLLDGLWQPARRRHRAAHACWARAGSAPTWSGSCSRWSPTGRWTRLEAGRRRVGHRRRGDPRPGRDGRRPGLPGDGPAGRGRRPRRRCRRRCSSPWPTCSTSRSTCCSSTPPAPTSNATPPDTGDDGELGFRRYGHSKDHRPDLPQIVIGLAVTREGIPVRVWCWPGNTNDHDGAARGQGRAAGLAAGPGRHRRRPRVLLRREPGLPAPGRRALDRRGADARRHAATPPRPLSRQGRYQPCATTCGSRRSGSTPRPDGAGSSATTPPRPNARRTPQREAALARISRAGPHQRSPRRGHDRARRTSSRKARPGEGRAGRAHPRRVRAARPPHPGPLAAPDPVRAGW